MKWLSASLVIIVLSLSSAAQHVKLNGRLVTDQKRPVPNTRITVAGKQGELTDANGRFSIDLSSDLKEGERVIINVGKVRGKVWVINHPLDGEWNLPNIGLQNIQRLDVIIVPWGSKALWTHARIEREMKSLSDRVAKLEKEGNQPKHIDFGEFMRQLAKKYGTTSGEATAAFDEWATAVKESADHHVKGLVDFYNQEFASSAKSFKKAAMKGEENVIEDWKLAGNSAVVAYDFRDALDSYARAINLISRAKSPEKWAEMVSAIAHTKRELGIRTEGEEALKLLSESVAAFREVLLIHTREQLPEQWAETQHELGTALSSFGSRVEAHERDQLLGEAVRAFRQALLVRTQERLPKEWAMTQHNLAFTLNEQGTRAEGPNGERLLTEAVAAYEAVLLVITRERPYTWAMTQNNLGNALQELGSRAVGETRAHLLDASVAAYQRALLIRTRERLPQEWAATHTSLGNALYEQSLGTPDQKGLKLLEEAVAAHRQALMVYIRDQLPQQWALAQNNLGIALSEQGTRVKGAAGLQLLDEAVAAYRQALRVNTRGQLPQAWASTQHNLGTALHEQGTMDKGPKRVQLLDEAVTAYRQALLVRTREHLPQDWASTQNNLGNALSEQGTRNNGPEGMQLLDKAVSAYRQALLVRTREHFPQDWAMIQSSLAQNFLYLGDWANAAKCYANVLQMYPDNRVAYQMAASLYHQVLFNYQQAFELNQIWLRGHPDDLTALSDSAERHFTTGRFEQSQQRIASLLTNEKLDGTIKIALRAIEIADLMALNRSNEVPLRMKILIEIIALQRADFKVQKNFEGTKHFINQDQRLAASKDRLRLLFAAMAGENRDEIIAGLKVASEGLTANSPHE